MPVLKRAKHEIFCQNIANGTTHEEAMLKAGYKPKYARQNSSKILLLTTVQERIKELQEEIADRFLLSKEEMLIELGRIIKAGNNREIILAIHQASKMSGFETDIVVNIEKAVEEMNNKELQDYIKRSCDRTSDQKESS